MKNKANFKAKYFTANPCGSGTYNALYPKTKNGTKPIKANFEKENPRFSSETQAKNLFMRNEPNFNNTNSTANPYSSDIYNDLQPKPKNGTKPIKPNFRNGKSPCLPKIKKMENEPNFCLLRPSLCFLDWILLLYEPRLRYSVWGATYAADQ